MDLVESHLNVDTGNALAASPILSPRVTGATVAGPDADQPDTDQPTTEFEVLDADFAIKVDTYTAPNPLRCADPGRLQAARDQAQRIAAARRAGAAPPEF